MIPLHKECESSFDESCSECRLELIKRAWTKILVNWINKCVSPELRVVFLTTQCPIDIVNKYRSDVCDSQLERIDVMMTMSEVEAFLRIQYPKLKLRHLNDTKELSNKLFILSSILLFHCCVNSITGAVEGDICSKLNSQESEMILKFCETLAQLEITVNNVENAVKETCEPIIFKESRKKKLPRNKKLVPGTANSDDAIKPCDAEFSRKFRSRMRSAKKYPVGVSTPLSGKKKTVPSPTTSLHLSSFTSDTNLVSDLFDSYLDSSKIGHGTTSDTTICNVDSTKIEVDVIEYNTDRYIVGNKTKHKSPVSGMLRSGIRTGTTEYNTQTIIDYDGTAYFPYRKRKQILIDDVMESVNAKHNTEVDTVSDNTKERIEEIYSGTSQSAEYTVASGMNINKKKEGCMASVSSAENDYMKAKEKLQMAMAKDSKTSSEREIILIKETIKKKDSGHKDNDRDITSLSSAERNFLAARERLKRAKERESISSIAGNCIKAKEKLQRAIEKESQMSFSEEDNYVAVPDKKCRSPDSMRSSEGEFVGENLVSNDSMSLLSAEREFMIAKDNLVKAIERDSTVSAERKVMMVKRKRRSKDNVTCNKDNLSLSSAEKEFIAAKQRLKRVRCRDQSDQIKCKKTCKGKNKQKTIKIKDKSLPAMKRESLERNNCPRETGDLKPSWLSLPRSPSLVPYSPSSPRSESPSQQTEGLQPPCGSPLSPCPSRPPPPQSPERYDLNKEEKETYPRNLADIYKKKDQGPCCNSPNALCRKVKDLPPMETYFSSSEEEESPFRKTRSKRRNRSPASEKGVKWTDEATVMDEKSSGDKKGSDYCKDCKCLVASDYCTTPACKSCLRVLGDAENKQTAGWMHNYAKYFSKKMPHMKSYLFETLKDMPKWKARMLICFAILPVLLILIAIIASVSSTRAEHKLRDDIKTVRLRAKLKATQPTWFWQCDKRLCKKVYQPKSTNTFSALSRCMLVCMGPQIWPHPIGFTHYSKKLVAVSTEKLNYKFRAVPSDVLNQYIGDAFKLFIEDLQRLEKVDLSPGNKSTDLRVLKMNIVIEVESDSDPRLRLNTDESYYLKLETKVDASTKESKLDIMISAPSFCGVRHGLETLGQAIMLDQTTGYLITLSELVIKDAPTYKYRGLMLDTARNYIPVSDIIRTVDGMAACKLNTFHWRISDSASFPLLLQTLPQLFEHGAYGRNMAYTKEDVKTVVNRGIVRGVRVVMEVAAPGPVGRAWSWSEDANCPKKNDNFTCENVICLRLKMADRIFEMLQHIYAEIIDMTGVDDIFHLSDSIFSLANCYYLIDEREGFLERALERLKHANKGFLPKLPLIWYTPHLNRENEARFWEKYGVQLFEWPSRPDRALGKYKVVHSSRWDLSCEIKKQRCIKYRSWQEMYAWKSWRTIEAFAIVGGEALLWTDIVDAGNLDFHLWPRAAAVAERLWSDVVANGTPAGEVYVRLDSHRWRMLLRGLKVQPIWPVWCSFNPHSCLAKIHQH